MSLESEVIGGIAALFIGLFGWMFKGTAKRANDACALSQELKGRVEKLEEQSKHVAETLTVVRIEQAAMSANVSNMNENINKVVDHFLEKKE